MDWTALSNSRWTAMRFLDEPVFTRWFVLSHDFVGIVTPNPTTNRRLLMNEMNLTLVVSSFGRSMVRLYFMRVGSRVVSRVVFQCFHNP